MPTPPGSTDLLFITLRKSEALFWPTTRYLDLALGPSLFHWESQSTTTAASATGQRSIHHEALGSRVLLYRCAEAFGYVREQRRQGTVTEPFVCLGFARYESHEGERPMAVRWGWTGRFRRGGCLAVPRHPWRWRCEGAEPQVGRHLGNPWLLTNDLPHKMA